MNKEPEIIINGVKMSEGEAMTIRVAIGSFSISLQDGLGDDETGRAICEGYQNSITDINKVMFDDL